YSFYPFVDQLQESSSHGQETDQVVVPSTNHQVDAPTQMPLLTERRSTRNKVPLIRMKDFVTTTKHMAYIDYNHLSSCYQAFIAASSTDTEPSNYTEVGGLKL
ncbi:hypothetical protein HAX54_051864, partial [Datura stramonium]|nr:hypothetical protein [Datura stramonium]